MIQIAREVAGLPRVALSQAVPYALCNGGSGASIDSILTTTRHTQRKLIEPRGGLPEDTDGKA